HAATPLRPTALGHRAIQRLRSRDLKALQPASERLRVVRFAQQMNMRVLNADVGDAKAGLREHAAQCDAHGAIRIHPPQPADLASDAQGRMLGMARIDDRACLVRRARALALWLATGSFAFTATALAILVANERELGLNVSLARSSHPRTIQHR